MYILKIKFTNRDKEYKEEFNTKAECIDQALKEFGKLDIKSIQISRI